jgi:hypothetical protein
MTLPQSYISTLKIFPDLVMFCEISRMIEPKVFWELEKRALAGDVIFASSMPIMSELLQYDEACRQTTMCKAEAIDRLCGGWALACPQRLVASELASAAKGHGIIGADATVASLLSEDRYWYLNVSNALEGLREHTVAGLEHALDETQFSNRNDRRRAML